MIYTVIEVVKGMLFWLLWQGVLSCQLYTVKKLFDIPVPSGDVTYQTLPRRE
jgi:hypothetical protein